MGCGTGVATRAVASRQGFSGKIKGIDLSPYLASVGEQLASSEGLGEYIEFQAGDTRNLDINDGEYDAVLPTHW